MGRDELIQFLRRVSRSAAPTGGSSGTSSAYRGVSRHAKGRWEARIGLAPVEGKRRYRCSGATTNQRCMGRDLRNSSECCLLRTDALSITRLRVWCLFVG